MWIFSREKILIKYIYYEIKTENANYLTRTFYLKVFVELIKYLIVRDFLI